MPHVILGLLMLWPQSLYELTKNFESGISLFYSSSTGSIKRALDRLLSAGHIRVASTGGRRGKQTFEITDSGRDELRRWRHEELIGADFETAALSRSFFLGLLPAAERPEVAARIERRIATEQARLEAIRERVATDGVPEEWRDVARYQLATLEYGLASCRTARDWARTHLV